MDTEGTIVVFHVADLLINEALRKNWHRGCFVAYSVQVPDLSLTELNIIPLNITQCIWDCMINARAWILLSYGLDYPVLILQPSELKKHVVKLNYILNVLKNLGEK